MSRVSGQPVSSEPIFATWVKSREGKDQSIITARPLGEYSFCADENQNNALFAALLVFFELSESIGDVTWPHFELPQVVMSMIAVMPGFVKRQNLADNKQALVQNIPKQVQNTPHFPFFQMIQPHHVSTILDAVIRGEGPIALKAISENPTALLEKWKVKVLSSTFEVTPLQAAVMTNDVELIEGIKKHFMNLVEDLQGRLIDGLAEMKNQFIEIYRFSLERYCEIQVKKIDMLRSEKSQDNAHIIEREIDRLKHYRFALEGNDLEQLVREHSIAQEHNTFDFKPYITAICDTDPNHPQFHDAIALIHARTPAEKRDAILKGVSSAEVAFVDEHGAVHTRQAVQATSFDTLTLIQKLNRFREKMRELVEQEIIFNPNHILEILRQAGNFDHRNKKIHLDQKFLVFSQLLGFAQRQASEPTKQDMRQGLLYLFQGEGRSRPVDFNFRHRSLRRSYKLDVSILGPDDVDGIGYRFALGIMLNDSQRVDHDGINAYVSPTHSLALFIQYLEGKEKRLQCLISSVSAQRGCETVSQVPK